MPRLQEELALGVAQRLAHAPEGADGDSPAEPIAPGAIEEALRDEQGNVARASARLGLSRSRVGRYIEREGIDLRELRAPATAKALSPP